MQRSIPVISKFRQQYIISTKVLSQTMSVSAGNNTATVVVKHDAKKSTFFIQLDQKARAILEYEKSDGTMDMYHTEVPSNYQGKGLAAILAKAAFDYAVENQLSMKLSCTYLQKYLNDNPKDEYKQLVVS